MLDLVLPQGSLEDSTIRLFEAAELPVRRAHERDYNASISDPRIRKVKILRPREIAPAVQSGHFDLGVTGHDCVLESGSDVHEVMDLTFNRGGNAMAKVVLAVPNDSSIDRPEDVPPYSRISTEYPMLTHCFFERLKIPVEISLSHGATEAKVPELADAIVDFTETGLSLRRAGLRVVGVLAETSTRLIANRDSWADPVKNREINEIRTLLAAVLAARGKVLIKLNVSARCLREVIAVLPTAKPPRVSPLIGGDYYAVEAVVVKSEINLLIPILKRHGAEDILEIPISKAVP